MTRVVLIAKPGHASTGVGRYVGMLADGLDRQGIEVTRVAPAASSLPSPCYSMLRRLGVDLRAFLTNYPVRVCYPPADVYHFTSQNLASPLLFRRPAGNVVVTVHDIIPYMLRNNPALSSYRTAADRLFDRMAMAGLGRADLLLADSRYTKQCLIEHLGIAPDKIEVVYLGVDRERFRPQMVPSDVRERYGLPSDRRYLVYVGSEDPRKNLVTLVLALAAVRRELPDVELIKVGRAHFDRERQRLTTLANQVGVRSAIRFLDDVPEEDLPLLYNLADVCVMPSLHEGFGFPALEAMACGTTVVCARAASLPEIVGDGGIVVDVNGTSSDAADRLAAAIGQVLRERDLREAVRARGIARAATFDWSATTNRVIGAYRELENGSLRFRHERRGRGLRATSHE